MKLSSLEKPNTMQSLTIKGKAYYNFCFDIIEEHPFFYYRSIMVPRSKVDYGTLVDAIISSEYSDSQMTAIINNFLLDSSNREEFDEMQKFRKFAKETAKELLTYLEDAN